ncbi:hypothetical protein PENTCL1PPCAC_30708, partial [Pristionchus entomophagus]
SDYGPSTSRSARSTSSTQKKSSIHSLDGVHLPKKVEKQLKKAEKKEMKNQKRAVDFLIKHTKGATEQDRATIIAKTQAKFGLGQSPTMAADATTASSVENLEP